LITFQSETTLPLHRMISACGLVFLLLFSHSSIAMAAESVVDWESLQSSYALFTKDPTDQNADKVRKILPGRLGLVSGEGKTWRGHKQADEFILKRLGDLESQVLRCRRPAIKLAYRFYTIADGKFAEGLDIMLGKLICRNPRLFLQTLAQNRRLVSRLESLLMTYGRDYVGHEKARSVEYQKRLSCLRKVRDPELQDTRDECVEYMEQTP
jgi:hypothetical protein